ncbi:hypothetical protein [Mediterraneibacter glycyrrhizinilyticus]|uniref:hypothetical protein n=1 Tax=Mediterraneibacter glycyrrhizinilyticus TaxID=342942 RepID=UPI0025A37D4A|nr:hypothetical protein [Mediterraneibacter glycyrrhizinilyticus]MDM8125541.1 hypothetical protein [Mediterraneibacter glycyrrhizinilyticus]
MRKKELVAFCNIIRAVPAFFLYSIIDIETRERLKKDIARNHPRKSNNLFALTYCLTWNKTFRNIFYFRTSRKHPLATAMLRCFFAPMKDIEIGGDIGGGVSHLARLRISTCLP